MTLPDYMQHGLERPLGISILAVLHFIGGVLLSIAAVYGVMNSGDPRFAEALATIGVSPLLVLLAVLLLIVLSVASAIGMWIGARWGWYLGSFYYSYAIVRNILALVTIGILADSIPDADPARPLTGPGGYFAKYSIRLVISLLIYLYFFNANIRSYFRLETVSKWPAVLIQAAICIAIAVGGSAWSFAIQ